MANVSLLGLCLLSLTWTVGLQSSACDTMFAVLGDSVTLPCAIPSIGSCSSVTWTVEEGSQKSPMHVLQSDCSLRINQLIEGDARIYTCVSGKRNSSVSLQFLNITERLPADSGKIELHCSLNTFKGLKNRCNNTGIELKWTTEDNTPITGHRFTVSYPSVCFSKLIINKKTTDHHRQWKCRLTQNEVVKASVSYITTVPDGVEEVFASAGESVSLTCSRTSSLGVSVLWTVGEGWLTDISHGRGQSGAFQVKQDQSLVIGRVSPGQAGEYRCSESTHGKKVLNSIRLHVLDVSAVYGPGKVNLTLTCVLTCANKCECANVCDFNLTWSGSGPNSWQSGSKNVNNSLISQLFLSDQSASSGELTCSVCREGVVMATKCWRQNSSLQTLAWSVLPLGLLTCVAAGGFCMYMKRKRDKDPGNKQSGVRMSHVYEDVHDVNNEELTEKAQEQKRQNKREAAATDGFYHFLQPGNQN